MGKFKGIALHSYGTPCRVASTTKAYLRRVAQRERVSFAGALVRTPATGLLSGRDSARLGVGENSDVGIGEVLFCQIWLSQARLQNCKARTHPAFLANHIYSSSKPTTMPSALVLGATGQTGQHVLATLLSSKHFTRVGEYGRRLTALDGLAAGKEKLEQKTIDFEKLEESGLKDGKWDVVFVTYVNLLERSD